MRMREMSDCLHLFLDSADVDVDGHLFTLFLSLLGVGENRTGFFSLCGGWPIAAPYLVRGAPLPELPEPCKSAAACRVVSGTPRV